MKILLATDSFPPVAGGSGWSTYELARGLRAIGHDILIVQPRPGTPEAMRERAFEGIRVIAAGFPAPAVPYLRNYFKNERLWRGLAALLSQTAARERVDLIHGQHVLTALPSIEAAHARRLPAVCTVRDYWPVCYWSDLLHTRDGDALCPACSVGGMTQCVRPRAGVLWPAALPMIPYMRANLARKRSGLAAADAIVAVSATIAADLRARAPELAGARIETIPNPIDVGDIRARGRASRPPMAGPYALYLGKLAPNKGTQHLVDIVRDADLRWPLAIVGDGPDRPTLEAAARASGRDIRFTGWADREAATSWLAHASLLVFPSRGPESLSRVLLEASALGIPIAAMLTGGTGDIVRHEETGLLSHSLRGLTDDVRRLAADQALRQRLGAGARAHAEATFAAPSVVARLDALYRELLAEKRA
jgi:glycosyltransferase involved in cell wall biosynthesis